METATLLAVLAAPLTVLVLVATALLVFAERRGRRSLRAAGRSLGDLGLRSRGDLRTARASAERLTASWAELRRQGDALDRDLAAWTASMVTLRTAARRVEGARLAPVVRVLRLLGALGRLALLVRTPAR